MDLTFSVFKFIWSLSTQWPHGLQANLSMSWEVKLHVKLKIQTFSMGLWHFITNIHILCRPNKATDLSLNITVSCGEECNTNIVWGFYQAPPLHRCHSVGNFEKQSECTALVLSWGLKTRLPEFPVFGLQSGLEFSHNDNWYVVTPVSFHVTSRTIVHLLTDWKWRTGRLTSSSVPCRSPSSSCLWSLCGRRRWRSPEIEPSSLKQKRRFKHWMESNASSRFYYSAEAVETTAVRLIKER